jgi:hypothetical protein
MADKRVQYLSEAVKEVLKVTDTLKLIRVVSKAWRLVGMDLIGSLEGTARGSPYIPTTVD